MKTYKLTININPQEEEKDRLTTIKEGAITILAPQLIFPGLISIFTGFGTLCGSQLAQAIIQGMSQK